MGQYIPPPSALNQIFNLLPNSRAEVSQRGDAGVIVNLTTARLIGAVDCCAMWASAGAVSAGTIAQSTNALVGSSGEAARASGVTLTGAAKLSWAVRMEQRDAELYKNQTCAFQVAVAHDVGADVNFTAIVKKANAADNWTAMTVIDTSAASAIPTATGTIFKFENVAMGDCSNGIEIEVQANCGAIANKNFDFTEWALTIGASAPTFTGQAYTQDFLQCQRYLPLFSGKYGNGVGAAYKTITNTLVIAFFQFGLPVFRKPTGLVISNAADFVFYDINNNITYTASNVIINNQTTTQQGGMTVTITASSSISGIFSSTVAGSFLYFTGAELF
jgi:hypothetical protein